MKKRRRTVFPRRLHSRNLALQDYWINKLFPQFILHQDQHQRYWIGTLTSTHKHQVYTIKIDYNQESPKVFITHPQILNNSPHTYADNSLCLHYPPDHSFREDKFIAKTILPWTCEWLYFYEIWKETGVWWGPEAPHQVSSPKGQRIVRKMARGAAAAR